MNPFQAAVLGVIQGLTEFLPVSSSGHLVIAQHLFGLKDPEVLFDVSVHIGTLVAVFIYFYRDLYAIAKALLQHAPELLRPRALGTAIDRDPDLKMAWLIVIGTIPTGIIGLLLHRIVDRLFGSILLAGAMLTVTGLLLFFTRWATGRPAGDRGGRLKNFQTVKALVIGTVQGIAIIPGISRSGSTIAAALFLGLERETAARYSFLLSIPAICGAALLTLKDVSAQNAPQLPVLLIGALTSCAVGYLALKFLVYIVKRGRLHYFAPYVLAAGLFALIYGA